MSSQVLKLLAVALLIGSLVLLVVAFRIARAPQPVSDAVVSATPVPQPSTLRKIVTATRAIQPGETVGTNAVVLAAVASPPPGAVEHTEDVVGKRPFTAISAGEPLLHAHFPESSFLTQSLRDDERAIAVRVDELIGVGGFLHPGDRVDVMAYIRADGQRVKENQSIVVLHSVRILSYAEDVPSKAANSTNASSAEATRSTKGRSTAVLAVKEAEVTRLTLAENAGALRLALRPAGQAEAVGESAYGVSLSEISAATTNAQPEPDQEPQGPRVLIIRGTRLDPVQFP